MQPITQMTKKLVLPMIAGLAVTAATMSSCTNEHNEETKIEKAIPTEDIALIGLGTSALGSFMYANRKKKQMKVMSSQIDDLQSKLSQQNDENKRLKTKEDLQSKKIDDLQQKYLTLEGKIVSLEKAQNSYDLSKDKEEMDIFYNDYKEKLKSMQKEKEKLENDLDVIEGNLEDVHRHYKTIKSNLDETKAFYQEISTKITEILKNEINAVVSNDEYTPLLEKIIAKKVDKIKQDAITKNELNRAVYSIKQEMISFRIKYYGL